MKNANLSKNIIELELDDDSIQMLTNNNIYTLEDVWNLKRIDLKRMGVRDSQINYISIKLQLLGLDLNRKVYSVRR